MSNTQLTVTDRARYLAQDPTPEEIYNGLTARKRLPQSQAIDEQIETAIAIARKFNQEVVKPRYKQIDLECAKDPDYLCWDFVKIANEYGLYTLFLPKIFGGQGLDFMGMYPFVEEIASVCPGLANVVGAHYLGVASIVASWNLRLINQVLREVVEGEKTGHPCLICSAITEPDAGTDTEETRLLERARIGSSTKKVKGGYLVNGSKIFISDGHFSTWHMVTLFTEKKRPSANLVMLAVKTGMKGFRHGRHEKKMGQKACVASELIFEDCFVPDEYCCVDVNDLGESDPEKRSEICHRLIDYVITSTRAGVAAFSVGAARGAYRTSLDYARQKNVNGSALINHQWAQIMLSDMYKNVNMGRAAMMESVYAIAMYGLLSALYSPVLYYAQKLLPKWFFTLFVAPFFGLKLFDRLFRKSYLQSRPQNEIEIQSGWASLVKVACGDIGVINSHMAIELMGIDGCRHDIGAEKYLRDAKLSQIYEGTQQLNRVNMFMNLVARNMPEVKVF